MIRLSHNKILKIQQMTVAVIQETHSLCLLTLVLRRNNIYWDIYWDYLLRRWRNTIYSLRRPPLLFAFTSPLPDNELSAKLWPFLCTVTPSPPPKIVYWTHSRKESTMQRESYIKFWNIELSIVIENTLQITHKRKHCTDKPQKNDWLYTR